MPEGIRSVFHDFCDTTSAHGLNRLRRGNTFQRALWAFVIIASIGGFTVHLQYLLVRFFTYPTVTEVQHGRAQFIFPDVTVCSSVPYNTSTQHLLETHCPGNHSYHPECWRVGYLNRVKEMWKLLLYYYNGTNPDVDKDLDFQYYNTMLDKYHGTWTNSVKQKYFLPDTSLMMNLEDRLFYCRYQGSSCLVDNFTIFRHPALFRCYTFKPAERHLYSTDPEYGLTLEFYHPSQLRSTVYSQVRGNRVQGYSVSIHAPNTRPNFQKLSTAAQVGFETELRVSMEEIIQMSRPNFPCMTVDPVLSLVSNPLYGEVLNFSYTQDDCLVTKMQKHLTEHCHCFSSDYDLPLSIYQQGFRPCSFLPDKYISSNLTYNLTDLWRHNKSYSEIKVSMSYNNSQLDLFTESRRDKLLEKLDCVEQQRIQLVKYQVTDSADCPSMCHKLPYSLSVQSKPWPASHETCNDVFFDMKEFEFLLNRKGKTSDSISDTFIAEAQRRLKEVDNECNLSWFRENFLSIRVYPTQVTGLLLREDEVYPLRNFFSDLGGTLGLWIGVSVITITELIELLMHMSLVYFFKRRSENESVLANNSNHRIPSLRGLNNKGSEFVEHGSKKSQPVYPMIFPIASTHSYGGISPSREQGSTYQPQVRVENIGNTQLEMINNKNKVANGLNVQSKYVNAQRYSYM